HRTIASRWRRLRARCCVGAFAAFASFLPSRLCCRRVFVGASAAFACIGTAGGLRRRRPAHTRLGRAPDLDYLDYHGKAKGGHGGKPAPPTSLYWRSASSLRGPL